MVCVVIMAGGRGERFWPKSRAGKPKQFADLTGNGNMLYLTYQRVANLVPPERIFVVTGSEYEGITKDSLPELSAENIIIEPAGRNTAPCIGLAGIVLEKRFPDPVMIVLPADHLIREEDRFIDTLHTGIDLARRTQGLVTVGIKPSRAETGYGYIKTGEAVPGGDSGGSCMVDRFVEKPDAERAGQFLADGGYLWNAGIFIWKVSVIMEAFRKYLPQVYEGLEQIKESLDTDRFRQVLDNLYPGFEKISVDYGIMEKADCVFTVPGDFYWDDVGTWRSLERIFGTDPNGNLLTGKVVTVETENTIVDAGKRLIAVVGVEDLIIVDTDDITFICTKDKADLVRELLDKLRSQNLKEYL